MSTPTTEAVDISAFFSNILKPGSSLDPTFLLIVDGAFTFLLVVLLLLLWLSSWSIHLFALISIELCLWASVKWFVNELKSTQSQEGPGGESIKQEKDQ